MLLQYHGSIYEKMIIMGEMQMQIMDIDQIL